MNHSTSMIIQEYEKEQPTLQASQSTIGIQTQTLNFPNAQLKDIGISGVSGGSSSRLIRKEEGNQNFYVPLKRRLMEQRAVDEFNQKQELKYNIKKVQVNLGDKSNQKIKV